MEESSEISTPNSRPHRLTDLATVLDVRFSLRGFGQPFYVPVLKYEVFVLGRNGREEFIPLVVLESVETQELRNDGKGIDRDDAGHREAFDRRYANKLRGCSRGVDDGVDSVTAARSGKSREGE